MSVVAEQFRRSVIAERLARGQPGEQSLRALAHPRRPFPSLAGPAPPARAQISAARRPAASEVTTRVGHSRVKPSDGHLRVASMPILLPNAGRSEAFVEVVHRARA